MAVISDIAGTTNDSFSINGKVTLFYSENAPNNLMGNLGDFCFTKDGDLYTKKELTENNNIEWVNIIKWMKITDKILPDAEGSKELVFDDVDINNNGVYNTTENITYDKNDNHLHDNVVIQNEITNNSSTIIPNIGYLNKNFVHNKGDEHIAGEKTFDDIIKGTSPDDNAVSNEIVTASWTKNQLNNIVNTFNNEISDINNEISVINSRALIYGENWIKDPTSQTLIQWGETPLGGDGGYFNVSLPIPFSNTDYSVGMMINSSNLNNSDFYSAQIKIKETNYFNVWCRCHDSWYGGSLSWIAIGK